MMRAIALQSLKLSRPRIVSTFPLNWISLPLLKNLKGITKHHKTQFSPMDTLKGNFSDKMAPCG